MAGPPHAQPGSLRSLRIAGRLANAFTLDLIKLGGARRDVIDVLLRAALIHANQAHIIRDPELQRRYAGLDDPTPDELRRPASIHAIAASLQVPYETARRRIGGLANLGVCEITSDGVIVASGFTDSPAYRLACQVQYDKLQVFYGRLRAAGVLEPPSPRVPPFDGAAPPLRLVGRLLIEYMLRFAEPINEHIGDVVTGLILMEMVLANTEHLSDSEAGTEAEIAGGFVPDRLRRPISALALANRLGIPAETVRRHVAQLVRSERCRKVGAGYIAPAEVLARPLFWQFMVDNQANLNRLFAALGEFGILQAWERERQEQAA